MRASITNKTSIFGIMGGLYNRKISGRSSMNRVTSRLVIPAGAKEGYQYMKMHNLLSRNPLGSGGVGKMFRLRAGGSIRTSSENSENNLGAPLKCQSQLGGDCTSTMPAAGCCTGTMACNWTTGTCYDPSPGDENNLGAPLKCQSQLGGDCTSTMPAAGCCTGTMACNWNTGTCYDPSPGDENNLGEQQEANLPPAEEGTCGPDKHNAETCSLHGDCWDGKCQCTGAWCSVDPVDGICDGVLIYPPGGGGVQCVLAPATARATRAPAASAAATNKTETEL